MTLRLTDLAPNFDAETTQGKISFLKWAGDSWVVLFSHPKDFTPVCTTELGSLESIKPEFVKRNVKIIGLSVDPISDHKRWSEDIKEVTHNLYEALKKEHGYYEGWSTTLIKD